MNVRIKKRVEDSSIKRRNTTFFDYGFRALLFVAAISITAAANFALTRKQTAEKIVNYNRDQGEVKDYQIGEPSEQPKPPLVKP